MRWVWAWWALVRFGWLLLSKPEAVEQFLVSAMTGPTEIDSRLAGAVQQGLTLYQRKVFDEEPLLVRFMDTHERHTHRTEWMAPFRRKALLDRDGQRYAASRQLPDQSWVYRQQP